jgi:hypothetical protein
MSKMMHEKAAQQVLRVEGRQRAPFRPVRVQITELHESAHPSNPNARGV